MRTTYFNTVTSNSLTFIKVRFKVKLIRATRDKSYKYENN